MSVWYITPSVRPVKEAQACIDAWRERGYNVALIRQGDWVKCDLGYYIGKSISSYLGLPKSINRLVDGVLAHDPEVEWFVHGGDDYWPDMTLAAKDIADSCSQYFARHNERQYNFNPATFGVMQPTGDRYGNGYIDSAAASAWMGREFCKRINRGTGPAWGQYFHYGWDEELQHVAIKNRIFWQRPNIKQEHKHWSRVPGATRPTFLDKPFALCHDDMETFKWRLGAGFPGSGPL